MRMRLTRKLHELHPTLLCLCWLCISLLTSIEVLAEPSPVGNWTGKHSRLVWLQDHGDGTDALARSNHLMLYGYDSEDGKGERPLLPNVGNFFKPLLTPDGQQVVVSNRNTRQMYLIEWASGKVTELGSGVAIEVWQEPKRNVLLTKTTWVYCLVGEQPEIEYGTTQPLYRFPLDNPEKKELVWDQTHLSWSNLQISRDGDAIGGLFPWPNAGVLWGKKKQLQRIGNGCWTSLSPDNSKLLWIFDGLHRNIQIHNITNGESWKVNMNGVPAIGGYEVYHPRWSNHPRYFVITGPYTKGEGGNKISGGGEKVEIFIGRFDEQARLVEDWIQVTTNNRADFYPDLWVEDGEKAQLSDAVAHNNIPAAAQKWPTNPEGLVFLWENMKATNQLAPDSPSGFFQCNIELRGQALHTKHYQLSTIGGWGETGEAGKKIGSVLAKSQQATVEFVLTPVQDAIGPIMTLYDGDRPQLQITQDQEQLVVHSFGANNNQVRWQALSENGKPLHFLLHLDGRKALLFKNGENLGDKPLSINFAQATINSFLIGDKNGNWQGTLENIALYNRLLAPQEVSHNYRLASQGFSSRSKIPTLILEGMLMERTEIPAPDAIGAYRRAMVVNTYAVEKVLQGEYTGNKIMVTEWAVLDQKIIKTYPSPPGTERLVLERFNDHPELEGERQMMDIFEPELEMFYRLL